MSKCVQSVPTWAACQFSAFELPPPSPQSARAWSWHDPSLKWLQRSHSKSRSRRKSCVPSVSPRDVLHQWWPKIRDPLIALASFRAWYCEVKPPKLIKAVWSKWWKNLRQTDCQLEPLPVGLFKSQIKSKKPCNSWLVGVTSPGYLLGVSGLVTFHQDPVFVSKPRDGFWARSRSSGDHPICWTFFTRTQRNDIPCGAIRTVKVMRKCDTLRQVSEVQWPSTKDPFQII